MIIKEFLVFNKGLFVVQHTVIEKLSTTWLWQQAKHHQKRLMLANFIAIVATCISVPIPLLLPLMVDEVLLEQPAQGVQFLNWFLPDSWQQPVAYIVLVLLFAIVMRVSSQALNILQNRQFTLVSKTLTRDIRQQLIDKLGRIRFQEYELRGSGGITSHLVTDIETLDSFIGSSLSRFVISILTVIGTASILLWIDWMLGLFILLINPVIIFLSRKMGQKVKHLKKEENQSFERFQQRLVETLDGLYQLRAANRERVYLDKLKQDAEGIRHDADHYAWKSDAASRLSFLMFFIGFEVFRAAAMVMVLLSDLSIGQIFAIFSYLWFMLTPIQELLSIQYSWFSAQAAMTRLNGLLSLEEDEKAKQGLDLSPLTQAQLQIEIQDLAFQYNEEQSVLSNLSLTIPAGKRVALVGASGGGKSTLIQLLLGLYRKQAGQILINGVAIEHLGYENLRAQTAVVLQQPTIFNDSLRANLTLGETHFSDQQLWHALTVAQLDDVVAQLADGLETELGRQGLKLSGGQRQRLAIARMVLTDPKLVIMDEATSALDTATEKRLQRALASFLKGRTTLIVAHRLSAIEGADLIYVLEDGQVIQSGSHHQLIAEQGLYQALYQ